MAREQDFITEYGDDLRLITPRFFYDAPVDAPKSEVEGREVRKEGIEMLEIRTAGDPLYVGVFPAHSYWKNQGYKKVTYADRFADQYEQFKNEQDQTKAGIPLEGAPFLSIKQRYELKAQAVYTVESLAAIDGKSLKNLGSSGRDMKNKAIEFLAKMNQVEDSDIASLRAELADLRAKIPETVTSAPVETQDYAEWSDDQLRDLIKEMTGRYPTGQPKRETLEDLARAAVAKDRQVA